MIIDHVDLRVRDRSAATRFYDSLLSVLGAVRSESADFTTWRIPSPAGETREDPDSFGITEDLNHVAGPIRVAFRAPSREIVDAIAALVSSIGGRNVEMDDGIYGDDVYAAFFEDPDGNRLEVTISS